MKIPFIILNTLCQPWWFIRRIFLRVSARHKILINISAPVMGLGNFILTLPLIRILEEKSPGSQVSLLVSKAVNPQILDLFPQHVKTIFCSERDYYRTRDFIKFVLREVRPRKFNLLINGNTESWKVVQLLSIFSGIPFRVGYKQSPERIKNQLNTVTLPNHLAVLTFIYDKKLAKFLGLNNGFEKQHFIQDHRRRVKFKKPTLGIHPGSNSFYKIKRWPIENYIQVASWFASKYGGRVSVFGTEEENSEIERIAASLNVRDIYIYRNRDLKSVKKAIRNCTVFISNDCGLMHLSNMLEVPTVAIFGPTSSKPLKDVYANTWFVEAKLDCRPCYFTEHYLGCGHEAEPPCLEEVTVNKVLEVIEEIIGN